VVAVVNVVDDDGGGGEVTTLLGVVLIPAAANYDGGFTLENMGWKCPQAKSTTIEFSVAGADTHAFQSVSFGGYVVTG